MLSRSMLPSMLVVTAGLLLTGCNSADAKDEVKADVAALKQVVSARSDEDKARDIARHPVETLSFFQIAPGMTVAEALPGGGWYSKILAGYLGKEGTLVGLNYDDDMWARFGFFSEERIKERIAATKQFPEKVKGFTDNGIKSEGYTFATVPESMNGKVDRVLFIRALHNMNRFEDEAKTMTKALQATHRILKKDGYVGVVQHRLAESESDKGANGSRGYLKESDVKAIFAAAGFELVASSDVNANPKDRPAESEIVWRLPPNYSGTRDDAEKKAAVDAIGESDRMTLLFKKAG